MIDILDRSHTPTLAEFSEYIANPLFDALTRFLETQCKCRYEMSYSGENFLPGWNVRFFRSGRTMCRLYPKAGCFVVLVVVGRKEKPQVELLLPQMSAEMRDLYNRTQEGMGQRWLMPTLENQDALYDDLLTLIRIRNSVK